MMSDKKPSCEGQMGSGESDDEFYNVKPPNTSTVTDGKEAKNETVEKDFSLPRTKVKYDYKFESSSDDDSDDATSGKKSKAVKISSERTPDGKKKDELLNDRKLPQSTSKVVEKINKVLKHMKQDVSTNKPKSDKSEIATAAGSTAKHIPTSTMGVAPPVVVVPPPMLVQPPHLAMGPTGMIVPSAIGIANQNVMVSPTNMLGNVIRGPATVSGLLGVGNPSMMNPIQTQGSVLGMTNDILQLQGNLMGLSHGNLMQIPGSAMTGMCMTGIPVQTALQSNIVGMQAPGSNIMASQGSILGNPNNILTTPGGVLMNPAMAVPNIMNSQGSIMGSVGMGTPGSLMLNMNNLVSHQGSRVNYPGNILSAQAINSVGSRNSLTDISKNQVNYIDKQTKTDQEWRGGVKSQSDSDKMKAASSKSPSPSDSDSKNDDGDEEDGSLYEGGRTVTEVPNTFKNDGSFMELFKKMSEAKASSNKDESSSVDNSESDSSNIKKPPVMLSGIVGKRRGGRVLKTGLVKKVKKENETEEEKGPKDAWSMYMAEVKKYREASCEEEGKTRPLVK